MEDARHRELLAALARLLAYPSGEVARLAREAADMAATAPGGPGSAPLERFASAAGATTEAALEEIYTATFDLAPACAPYVGIQLLGPESPVRGPLLARFVEVYAAEGFRPRAELPDHVAEVLDFLSIAPSGPVRDDLVRDGLAPAIARMIEALDDRGNPYRDLLLATRELLAPAAAAAETAAAAGLEVRR